MSVAECHPVSRAIRSTEPTLAQEPVTVDEARSQCSLDGIDAHDPKFLRWIPAARAKVEIDTGLVAYTGTFTKKLTEWPDEDWFAIDDVRPVTSISSLTYIDGDGATQTLATSVYAFESSGVKQFVRLKYGQTWPATRGDINGITVTFVAGHATVAAVPALFKSACLLLINHWFESRGSAGDESDPPAYTSLVNLLGRRSYP